MYKQIFTLSLLLAIGFSCNSPFSVKFVEENPSFPAGDPKLAAMTFPSLLDRFSYGVHKQICPGKSLKTVEKTMKFVITQNFVKNIITTLAPNPATLLSVLPTLAAVSSQVISDSLSPDALGYEGTRQAMQAAIGTAISSNYSCLSIEASSQLYYFYSRRDYVSDVCGKSDSLASILKILKKAKAQKGLQAVSIEEKQRVLPSFSDIYLRNPDLGNKVKTGKITREKALLNLVSELKKLPLCHEVAKDYFSLLETMANKNDPYFFEMFDAVKLFLENCPLKYSGFVMESVDNESLVFVNDFNKKIEINLKEIKNVPETNVSFDFSGPLPLKGEDLWFEDLQTPDTREFEELKKEKTQELKIGYLVMIPLMGLVFWRMKKDEKT